MKITLLMTVIIVIGMSIYGCANSDGDKPHYCKYAYRLMNQHIREMESKGFGVKMTGGGFMKDVEHISLGFYSSKTATIDEARKFYVPNITRFLSMINQDEAIRPYLHNYPFELDNLTYHMSFQELPVDESGVGPIVFVFCGRDNDIVYCVDDPNSGKVNTLRTVHREPYAEALRIVREQGLLP